MKFPRLTRDLVFLIALFVVLGAMIVYVSVRRAEQEQAQQQAFQSYSSHSSQEDGMLGLHDWLNTIGYSARRIEYQAFRISDDVRFLFIIGPTEAIDRNEALYLLDWVERGNTLYLADAGFVNNNQLFDQLNLQVETMDERATNLTVAQPLLDSSIGQLDGSTIWGLETTDDDFVPFIASARPILIRMTHGQGVIWVTTDTELLTNGSLRDPDNAKLALGVLGNLPRGSVVSFDEYHHGLKGAEGTFANAVYNTPWGWGLIFTLLLGFGYLVLNGKRFGRTIPVRRTLALRTPSEYVVSMANLFRRANKRGMVLQHYRHALKRRLGRAFHLNPDLSDDRYVEMIMRMRPELDQSELTRIFNDLRRAETTEMDLVKSVEHSVTFGTKQSKNKKMST